MSKILIIEDDQLVARMYENAFTFEGFEVQHAEDGEKGIALAQSMAPDLILLDIMLPNMNGLEVLDQLKKAEKSKNVPIVMLSNIAGNQALETALQRGAVLYIIKSEYDPKQVVDTVRKVLSGEIQKMNSSSSATTEQTPPTSDPQKS